ncbi:hypothetical protein AGMMS49949_09450 [Alphaproteobacteria bacterium]|nr:hypothetical protein AGMMS49949_09450 [Alphaproteobacteria bacterium]GHS98116.1 hypothetical protein AGMMS50296_5600 [Alphaproteobacteria bacterium]
MNAEYAGRMFDMSKLSSALQRKYPHGVPFTGSGFPDFTRYSIRRVKIKITGDNNKDALQADKAAGFVGINKRPDGYTWHHHHDCETMELIPTDLNAAISHTGGAAIVRAKLGDFQ